MKKIRKICALVILGMFVIAGMVGFSVPAGAQGNSVQYALLTVAGTGPYENQLMFVDPSTCFATSIGLTQDSDGTLRQIRGLAYYESDESDGKLYGVTRQGDIVKVDRFTALTTYLGTVAGASPNFWSGLAIDPEGEFVYTVNAFGSHMLAKFELSTGDVTEIGPTKTASGSAFQILGLAFVPDGEQLRLYGANRSNDNIVEIDPDTGEVFFTWGNAVVGANNRQQIAVHPDTQELYGIHDHSNKAALTSLSFITGSPSQTFQCELPFGIVESVGGGNDTYGWGGLAFVPLRTVVAVDIKPGSCPNPLNTKSKGVLPVAVLGTANFDVTQIDPATVSLEGVSPLRWTLADVGTPFEPALGKDDCFEDCSEDCGDDCMDIMLNFDRQEVVEALGEVSDRDCLVLTVTGNLKQEFGGNPIIGEDVVLILKKGKE